MTSPIIGTARGSDELSVRAHRVLPGGSTHMARAYDPPIYVTRAQGSHKWLVDGRELIDYTMGHGALLLGHAHPAVVSAVRTQVGLGTHFGAAHPLEVQWAELITGAVASVDEVRFTASGTEAVMLAMRIARAATGRDVVAKFHDHFHGWYDAVSVDLDATGRPAVAPGVAQAQADLTRIARAENLESVRAALADGRVAALIVEASGAHYGRVPLEPEMLRTARSIADETGTLLVFDEVVTGFRVAPGGMQSLLGVRPDLTVFGKVMAGGLPGGAVGGRRDLLELLAGPIQHPGTFNANPLTAAAGLATLQLVADGAPQRTAEGYARTLASEWREALETTGVAGSVAQLSSILHVTLDDPVAHAELGNAMRAQGVDLLHTSAFCSTAHTLSDLEETAGAFERALRSSTRG